MHILFSFFKIYNHLTDVARAGCFTLVVFLPSSGYFCSLSYPHHVWIQRLEGAGDPDPPPEKSEKYRVS